MPNFFFHVCDDMDVPDQEGANLRDITAAREHAVEAARVLMCETLAQDGRISLHHRIDIEDDAGGVIASVPFGEAVRIEGLP
jgi:hypothetical protein